MPLSPESLAHVMGYRLDIQGYRRLFPACNAAMVAAGCTTVQRSAGWFSQIGHESGGLRWFTELGDNCVNYEWRDDLGNNQSGDGCLFKGRGPIQVTGRAHYTNLSRWAFERKLVPTPTFFVDDPEQLASQEYGFIGAVWYWLTHTRPDDEDGVVKSGNQYCDEGDIVGLTKWVNGGTNGLENPWPSGRRALWEEALKMGDEIVPTASGVLIVPNISPRPDWAGDPTFLPDLLESFGVRYEEYPGWRDRGHGDFAAIWGVVWHHTGNVNETNEGIAHHPALGLAANMLIHPDGLVTLTGVGVAWHAGRGCYPGLPEDCANQYTIGIECAYGPDEGGAFTLPWPREQVDAMIKVGAALQWFLGYPTDHNIAHKEWAGQDNPLGINKQGKPDPANFDMGWFRNEIGARAAAGPIGEDDPLSDPAVIQMISNINTKVDQLFEEYDPDRRAPTRSFFGKTMTPVETPLGYVWNLDGNMNEIFMSFAYLFDVPDAVAAVEGIASGGVAPDSWAGRQLNSEAQAWLAEFGQQWCRGLMEFKKAIQAGIRASLAQE